MKKSYIKTNIIGFVIAIIIASGFVVYAAVTFPSKDVTYENGTSGLESTNVQGAIDELYVECTKEPTTGEQIIENAQLEKDPYECRYFFTGTNPNNYITFNNENAEWRIMSVGCDGTIKIMKNNSIGEMAFDSYGSSDWSKPVTLNTYLNGDYFKSLSSEAQSQIVDSNFGIGIIIRDNNDLAEQVSDENDTIWTGKIAIPTISEYLRTNSNKNDCETIKLNSNNRDTCKTTNWMYLNSQWWTLSYSGNGSNYYSNQNGYFNYGSGFGVTGIRPTLSLTSDIKITGGDGSQNNPYTIE